MTQYLVAIHHPDDFDPSSETDATRNDISALNREMVAAGVRVFVGGLVPVRSAMAVRRRNDNGDSGTWLARVLSVGLRSRGSIAGLNGRTTTRAGSA